VVLFSLKTLNWIHPSRRQEGASTLTRNDPVKPPCGSSRIGVDLELRFAIAEHRSDASPLDHVFRDFQIHCTAVGGAEEHQADISPGRCGNGSESRGRSRWPFGVGFRTEGQHLQINPIKRTQTRELQGVGTRDACLQSPNGVIQERTPSKDSAPRIKLSVI